MLKELMGMSEERLKKVYTERELEPETAPEGWRPTGNEWLVNGDRWID